MSQISRARQTLRATAPAFVRRWWLDRKRRRLFGNGDGECRTIFENIYRDGLWGGDGAEPNSGPGSQDEATADFVRAVRKVIAAHGLRSVVDIGCGDFRVSRQIVQEGLEYTGVDVVQTVVDRNNRVFGSDSVRFLCADAVHDELPPADLCITREVLQHLSNTKISAILDKIARYPFVIICENHPDPARLKHPNADKPTGHDTRLFFDSGIYPERPPFSMSGGEILCRTPANAWLISPNEEFVTYLFKR